MTERYDVFISYNRQVDEPLAVALERGLQRFAKPALRRRALRVFRDDTNLSANPGLWSSIREALDASDHLLVLASPAAASSRWVAQEVEHWRSTTRASAILLAVTGGEVIWDELADDFDIGRSTAIPSAMSGAFPEEPRYIDLRWADGQTEVSASDPRLRDAVADLAAPLHDRPKADLVGEDLRQHRRMVRLILGAVAVLVVLTVAAIVAALVAIDQRDEATRQGEEASRQRTEAEQQAAIATARELAARSQLEPDPYRRLVLAIEAEVMTDQPLAVAQGAYAGAVQAWARVPGSRDSPPVDAHAETVRSLDWHASGLVASAGADGTLRVWSGDGGERGAPIAVNDWQVIAVRWTPDGRRMVSVSLDSGVRVWSRETGDEDSVPFSIGDPTNSATQFPISVAVSPDGTNLVEVSWPGNEAQLWDVASGSQLGEPLPGATNVGAVAWVPDGSRVVTGHADGTLTLWDLDTRTRVSSTTVVNAGAVDHLAVSSDSTIAAALEGGSVVVWDGIGASTLATRSATRITSLAWSPNEERLAIGNAHGDVGLWSAEGGDSDPRYFPHDSAATSIAWSPDGIHLAVGDDRGGLTYWIVGLPTTSPSSDVADPTSIDRVPESDSLAVNADGRLMTWDTSRDEWLAALPADAEVEWSFDGTRIAVAKDSNLQLWDAATGALLVETGRTGDGVTFSHVLWSPDGTLLATYGNAEARGSIGLWDAETGKRVGSYLDGIAFTNDVAWSPDGSRLAAASDDGAVHLWDVASHRSVGQPLRGHAGVPSSVAWSSRGDIVASGGEDGTVVLWDVTTGRQIGNPIVDHTDSITDLAWSATGELLASASVDSTVRLWDPSGIAIGPPLQHAEPVSMVAWSTDGQRIATVSDGIEIWTTLSEPDACRIALRALGEAGTAGALGPGAGPSSCTDLDRAPGGPALPVVNVHIELDAT